MWVTKTFFSPFLIHILHSIIKTKLQNVRGNHSCRIMYIKMSLNIFGTILLSKTKNWDKNNNILIVNIAVIVLIIEMNFEIVLYDFQLCTRVLFNYNRGIVDKLLNVFYMIADNR